MLAPTRYAGNVRSLLRLLLAKALETEWAGRNRQGIDSRMKQARFPGIKTLEAFDFDFDFQPSIDRQVVRHLAGTAFIERAIGCSSRPWIS
jgi:DNA replication protein DnaC